jgi:hypothetical protein
MSLNDSFKKDIQAIIDGRRVSFPKRKCNHCNGKGRVNVGEYKRGVERAQEECDRCGGRGVVKSRPMTRVDLAEAMGVGKGQVTNMLHPDRNLTLETVEKVAAALGMEAEVSLAPVKA